MRKVVLLVSSFPKLSETFIVSKFLGLLARGWDVHIVCNQSDPSEWTHFPELERRRDARRRVCISWPHRPRWLATLLTPFALLRTLLYAPRSTLRYLTRGWLRFGPDILRRLYLDAELIILQPDLIHFVFGPLAVGRMYLKDLLGCKITVSFRGYDLNYIGLDNPNYYQEVWEKADALHLLGKDLWQRARRRGCPLDKPHILIPPAIDTDYFSPYGRAEPIVVGTPQRPLRILGVGRLDWRKGYEYTLQAVRYLLEQGVQCECRIVGGGGYLEAIAFARHQLGLENFVNLMGAVPRSDVKAQMEWADVFLHAAVSEGFCNAVIEAQAMALPVVCTDAGGLPENVGDSETGFVVPRRDPQALAGKLALLARDPTLRSRMGAAGRNRVCSHFRTGEQIKAFDYFYQSLLSSEEAAVDEKNVTTD